jgi:hypothetical protein
MWRNGGVIGVSAVLSANWRNAAAGLVASEMQYVGGGVKALRRRPAGVAA